MVNNILVYWIGNIGIAGKGPNLIEPYNPDKTILDIIQSLHKYNLGYGKRMEILKFEKGNIDKYDKNNPYWSHNTKLSEYLKHSGAQIGNDIMLIYCILN